MHCSTPTMLSADPLHLLMNERSDDYYSFLVFFPLSSVFWPIFLAANQSLATSSTAWLGKMTAFDVGPQAFTARPNKMRSTFFFLEKMVKVLNMYLLLRCPKL